MERRRLIINFKNTPEEIALYEKIKNHSSISGYVKDILRGLLKETDKSSSHPGKEKDSEELDNSIKDVLGGL